MARENDNRAQLISTIWSLKTTLSKHPNAVDGLSFVHFNTMLRDEDYRQMVLNKAAASEVDAVREIALEALSIDMPGALIRRPEKDAVTEQATQETPQTAQDSETAEPSQANKRRFDWRHLAAGIGLITLSGGVLFANMLSQQLSPTDSTVSGSIHQDTVWHAETTYTLDGLVFVEGGAKLTIEPGTRILGNPGSALIVTRDSTLNAQGSRQDPIVFTSSQPVGRRDRGAWGGVVLLGNAPVNTGTGHIEGIDKSDPRGIFGGSDINGSCGVMKYVRIEFAGYEISTDNELNGLTLGGCGAGTLLSHIQVHMSLDDGIEFFGGTSNLKHILISRPGDDGLDWDRGWRGKGQFIVVQQGADDGDNCIEADNYKKDNNALPRSAPVLSNLTLVGSGDRNIAQRGILLRRGTGLDLRNTLVSGFTKEALDIRDEATVALVERSELQMAGVILAHRPSQPVVFGNERGDKDDDGGFSEQAWFVKANPNNLITPKRVLPARAHSQLSPSFVPSSSSLAASYSAAIPQDEFWDEGANYVGAIRPGEKENWLNGWTEFPVN